MSDNVSKLLKMILSLIMSFFAFLTPLFALCVLESRTDIGYHLEDFSDWTYLLEYIISAFLIVGFLGIIISYLTGFSVIKTRLINNIVLIAIWIFISLYMVFGICKLIYLFQSEGLYTEAYIPFLISTGLLIAYFIVPAYKSKRY